MKGSLVCRISHAPLKLNGEKGEIGGKNSRDWPYERGRPFQSILSEDAKSLVKVGDVDADAKAARRGLGKLQPPRDNFAFGLRCFRLFYTLNQP